MLFFKYKMRLLFKNISLTKKVGVTLSSKIIQAACYFGGARSKGFATLRNVSKLQFFDKIGHAKSVGFRFYSTI